MIAQRLNPLFAYCAKDDGKVIGLTDKGVSIEYKDGKKVGIEIGRQFGRSEGSIFPFDIEPCVKEGQTFKKGKPIVYNTGYFEFDPWNQGHLVMKSSLTAKTLLWETKQTHEDASSISQKLSEKMGTRVTYMRSFIVNFEQNVHHVAKLDQVVKPHDILMSIEDEITSNLGSFG
ncbi:MAG TPA: hypothetical protein VN843_14635, partial [Anaerolineales bacterium]|nr:hypothetical protein [Anaerolineales bacterium]